MAYSIYTFCSKKIIRGLLFGSIALVTILALISYHPYDPSYYYASTQMVPMCNWIGVWGAEYAAWSMYWFSWASYGISCFFVMNAYVFASETSLIKCLIQALCIVLLMCITNVEMLGHGYSSGKVGYVLYPYFISTQYGIYIMTAIGMISVALLIYTTVPSIMHRISAVVYVCGTALKALIIRPLYSLYCSMVGVISAEPNETINSKELAEDISNDSQLKSEDVPEPKSVSVSHAKNTPKDAPSVPSSLPYKLPSSSLFKKESSKKNTVAAQAREKANAMLLEQKLQRFGIYGSIEGIKTGPVVTVFEYAPRIDTKLSKIVALEDDLALALQAVSVRIIAPIAGTHLVGFEVAHGNRTIVPIADIFHSSAYKSGTTCLPLILGVDTTGNQVITDLVHMPHLLVAGSTGSGKSVALNGMLASLLGARRPSEMKLVLIDPKRLEFGAYSGIAHLLFPVVTSCSYAIKALQWVVQEMERRYELLARVGVRNIGEYHECSRAEQLPYIVVIIDELADLMMTAGRDIEILITRIAQMARASGIHMIVATQRPSVDVITGLIKVNFPSRIAFRVTSKIDSRTILDSMGAEKLLGAGDMLFLNGKTGTMHRVHGAYISDEEIKTLVRHIVSQQPASYLDLSDVVVESAVSSDQDDELLPTVVEFVQSCDEVSISLLQRRFKIGYNRSARLIDALQARGIITPPEAGKVRKVVR